MIEIREIAAGFRFPEGPVAMSDGTILLVEVARGTLTRVTPDGAVEVVAECGGGPTGAALGPDSRVYVCNGGGACTWVERDGLTLPLDVVPEGWRGGFVQRIDLEAGVVETLYTECEGRSLRWPNDLVFDASGGFWFTDSGVFDERTRIRDVTGVYYARPDGSHIREVIFPLDCPNGLGISPQGDRLYVVETYTARVWAWDLAGPGELAEPNGDGPGGGTLLAGLPGYQFGDGLAVDAEGWVNVATPISGGITSISPDGRIVEFLPLGDQFVTNLCFGGEDLRTLYVTLGGTGGLRAILNWPRRGVRLAFS